MKKSKEGGFTLLITLLLITVLLGVSGSLLNVVLRQYQLSGIAETSEMAFQAANAGMECALYHDFLNFPISKFDVEGDNSATTSESIACMNAGVSADLDSVSAGQVVSGNEQLFRFEWGSPLLCTEFSIYKFHNSTAVVPVVVDGATLRSPCAIGAVCTVIKARGYSTSCGERFTNPRTVERELIQMY